MPTPTTSGPGTHTGSTAPANPAAARSCGAGPRAVL